MAVTFLADEPPAAAGGVTFLDEEAPKPGVTFLDQGPPSALPTLAYPDVPPPGIDPKTEQAAAATLADKPEAQPHPDSSFLASAGGAIRKSIYDTAAGAADAIGTLATSPGKQSFVHQDQTELDQVNQQLESARARLAEMRNEQLNLQTTDPARGQVQKKVDGRWRMVPSPNAERAEQLRLTAGEQEKTIADLEKRSRDLSSNPGFLQAGADLREGRIDPVASALGVDDDTPRRPFEAFGADPASNNAAAKVGRAVGTVTASLPFLSTGGASLTTATGQMATTAYQDAYQSAKDSGMSDEEARAAAAHAATSTAVALPLFLATGRAGAVLGGKLAGEAAGPVAKALAGTAGAFAGNVAASSAIRAAEAPEGQALSAAVPNLESLTMDGLFALYHGADQFDRATVAQSAAAKAEIDRRTTAAAPIDERASPAPEETPASDTPPAERPPTPPLAAPTPSAPREPVQSRVEGTSNTSKVGDRTEYVNVNGAPEMAGAATEDAGAKLEAANMPVTAQVVREAAQGRATDAHSDYLKSLEDPAVAVELSRNAAGVPVLNADNFVIKSPAMQAASVEDGQPIADRMKAAANTARENGFQHLLKQSITGSGRVLFTVGGPGSGKSSVGAFMGSPEFIVDSVHRDPVELARRINDALASGRTAHVMFVERDPADAMFGNLDRVFEEKRMLPGEDLVEAHVKARQTIKEIAQRFAGDPRVHVEAIRNATGKPAVQIPISEVGDLNLDDTRSRVHAVTDAIADGTDPRWKRGAVAAPILEVARRGRSGVNSGGAGEVQPGSAGGEHATGAAASGGEGTASEVSSVHQAEADLLSSLRLPQDTGEPAGGMKMNPRQGESGATTLIPDVLDKIIDAGQAVFRSGMDFARWSREMIAQLGEKVRPYLERAFRFLNTGGIDYRHGKQEQGGLNIVAGAKKALKEVRDPKKFGDFERATNQLSATMQRTFLETRKLVDTMKRAVPEPVKREALGNWIEAKGEAARTGETQQQVLDRWAATNKAKKYQAGYDAARNLSPAEQAHATAVEKFFADKLSLAKKWGVVDEGIDHYVNRIFKPRDLERVAGAMSGGRMKPNASFAKHRFYDSAFGGEQPIVDPLTGKVTPGLEHVTKDIGEKMALYAMELNKVVAQRQMIADLSKSSATDGRPLVFPVGGIRTITDATGAPQSYLSFPASKAEVVNKLSGEKEPAHDYKPIKNARILQRWKWVGEDADGKPIVQQSDLAVHPEVHAHLDNITKGSSLTDWYNSPGTALAAIPKLLVKGIDKAQSWAKEAMFAFSGFHYVTIAEHAAEHRINPLGELAKSVANLATAPVKPLHDMVTKALNLGFVDYNDARTQDWMRHGLMVAPDHVSAHSFMDGVGGTSLLGKIPLLGRVARAISDDLFTRFIPSLKIRMADTILKRNLGIYSKELAAGKVSVDDVKYLASHQVNAALSHLNMIDLGRNPTLQHFLRLGILAPDFTESRLRFLSQGAKALLGSKAGVEQAAALAFGAGVLYLTCRVVNGLLNEGDTHNDVKDAFTIVNGKRRYEVRSVQGDVVKAVSNWGGFAQGRLAPTGKFLLESLSGVNYRGEKVTTPQAAGEMLASYIPISMRALPGLRELTATSRQAPVSPWEQFLGTIGVHSSRYSPITETYQVAREFMKAQGKAVDAAAYPVSKYQQLRYALEDGDMERAREEWKALRSTEKDSGKLKKGFETSTNHPFTGGTAAMEEKFTRSLRGKDKVLYQEALRRRRDIIRRFGLIAH